MTWGWRDWFLPGCLQTKISPDGDGVGDEVELEELPGEAGDADEASQHRLLEEVLLREVVVGEDVVVPEATQDGAE